MERDDLLKRLDSLAQLDRDAVSIYDEALEHVTDDEVRTKFQEFRGEHEYHAKTLEEAITRLGGEARELEVDAMGRVADWVTSIRSLGGTKGALHALRTAERYHNRRYGEALEWSVEDTDLVESLRRFRDDERRQLEYVEARIEEPATARGQ